MPGKTPESYSIITYLGVVVLAVWGGVVNYIQSTKNGRVFRISELVGESAISGFVGVLTFYMCEAAELHGLVTAALIGISGHFGGRSIYIIENYLAQKIGVNLRDKK
jgi:hypothetical protein